MHGWTKVFKKVKILGSEPPDEEIVVQNPLQIKKIILKKTPKNMIQF